MRQWCRANKCIFQTVTFRCPDTEIIFYLFFQILGDVLFLGLSLCGALYFPHQRLVVGRRYGRNHLHVLSQGKHKFHHICALQIL